VRKTSVLIIVSVGFVLTLCSVAAYADTHWVNLSGSNEAPYTSYATGAHEIQDAVDVAEAGDTVRLAAGGYDIDTTVSVWDSLAFVGAAVDSTIISFVGPKPSMFVYLLNPRGHNYIADLTLDGNRIGYSGGVGAVHGWVEIDHCSFHDLQRVITLGWGEVELHDCLIEAYDLGIRFYPYLLKSVHHNTFKGSSSYFVYSWSECEIYNNVFHAEHWRTRSLDLEAEMGSFSVHNNLFLGGWTSVWLIETTHAQVFNNTIIGTVGDWGPIFSSPGWFDIEAWIINNVILDCVGPIGVPGDEYPGESALHFHYNIIWPPFDPVFDVWYGYIDLDTVGMAFVDPMLSSDSNYYLQAGSPCINAGDPAILDVDGSRSDIGMYGGPGGTTYDYPEEAPCRADTLIGESNADSVYLTWFSSSESDLAEYRLYRDYFSGFSPHAGNLLANIILEDTTYVDSIGGLASDLFYLLTAVDTVGLESAPSNEVAILWTGILDEGITPDHIPRTPCILGNYPNPFNSSTTIEYFIPDIGARPTLVELNIYDSLGRRVATLVNKREYPGKHRVLWDGRREADGAVSSGVYFARLKVWGHDFGSSAKLVLQK